VRDGDTLARIAAEHGTRYQAIAQANGISSPYIIRKDQVLRVPDVKAQLAAQEKRHAMPATTDTPHDGGSGGLSLDALGKKLADGASYLHTVFFRNGSKHPQTDLMHSSRAPWMEFAQENSSRA
jgi:flagellar protein FlgJ